MRDVQDASTLIVDTRGRVVDVTPGFTEMFGWARDDAVGLVPPFPWWSPEQAESLGRVLQSALADEAGAPMPWPTVVAARHADGHRLDVVVTFRRLSGQPRSDARYALSHRLVRDYKLDTDNIETISIAFEGLRSALERVGVLVSPRDSEDTPTSLRSSIESLMDAEGRPLTSRQREILELVVLGRTSKEIGTELGISTRTVEVHRRHLMTRLGADSVASLVRVVFEKPVRSVDLSTPERTEHSK